jgi:tetratricopeptide (TPR) repeat protein
MRPEGAPKLNSALTRPITPAMQPSVPASPTPADAAAAAATWRARVDDVERRAMEALATADLSGLAALFAEVDGWADDQRAYQARRRMAEAALAYRPPQPALWPPAFAATARCLLDALEREPREPVLLNLAGVLLYELTESGAAEALFRAAMRLDAGLEHVEANLAACRARGQAPPPRGAVAASLRALGKRGRAVAAKARPAEGLTLSLVMIVKDEQEMLPGCLEAVKDVVDEMIVVDTGSSDDTVAIAERFGATVVRFPWNGSFADARNVSIDHATGHWVMYLDADEHLMPEDAPALRELLGRTWREAFYLVETNYTGGEDSGGAVTHHALRLWRRRPQYRFEGRIHEQKTHTMPTYLPERFETTTIRMRHYGYLRSRITAKDKSRRNIELLEIEGRENPSPFNRYNLGSEYLALGDAARARGHFDAAWSELRGNNAWQGAGYAPLLVARVATARRAAGDIAGARQAVAEGLAAYPDHTDLVLEDAMCARELGALEEARSLALRCLAMGDAPARYAATVGSGTFLATCLLAELEQAAGRDAEAERLYREALEMHGEYVAPVLALVSLMAARGATETEIADVVPDGPSAWLLAATALYESGRHEAAGRWFQAVLDAQPGNGAARIGLVEALLSQRRYEDAGAEAALEPADSPLAATAMAARMFAIGVLGDGDALEAQLAGAATAGLAGHDVELYRAWADSLRGGPAGRMLPEPAADTAATALEALLRVEEFQAFEKLLPVWESIDIDPRARHERLARIYLRRGFLESAADEWIASVRIEPDAGAMLGLAQVAVARGMRAEAVEFAEEAVALDPAHPVANRYLAALASTARAA